LLLGEWRRRVSLVIVVQRYVPSYRVPLFDALSEQLDVQGLELLVAHGVAHGAQKFRNDNAVLEPWAQEVREITLPLPRGVTPTWKRVSALSRRADLIVAELASTSLNTCDFLIRRPDTTILWGHGKSYVKAPGWVDTNIEHQMARRASHVMTYTEAGRSHLLDAGIASERVTAVGNSTDTAALARLRIETLDCAPAWRARLGSDGPVALFVGGLDREKRIQLLVDAGQVAARLDPSFRLVVAGSGRDGHLVERHIHEPWLLALSHVTSRDMAALSHVASAIWMPGRVGLIAVDALAFGLPVLTTRFPFHAPELDYLVEGQTVHFLPDAADSYAAEALAIMRRPATEPAASAQTIPSVEAVAARMAAVITGVMHR
jgi:glycosyltransferase involved in cell wall biosynthesis